MKILILVDYLREDYFIKDGTGKPVLDFGKSATGQEFKHILTKLNLKENVHYSFDYVYTTIPPVKTKDYRGNILAYKKPLAKTKAMEPYYERIKQLIAQRPDIELVIPTGPFGIQALAGSRSNKVNYSSPSQVELGDRKLWILPLQSQERINMDPNVAFSRNNGLAFLKNYLVEGLSAFDTGTYQSIMLDDYAEALRVLDEASKAPLSAWDTETNTLDHATKGAQILVFTFSFDENVGYELPFYHRDFHGWTEEQRNTLATKIYEIFKGNTYKVMHNSRFDLSILLGTIPQFDYQCNHVIDTKDGYYLAINQTIKGSLRLTDLSKELTNLGGYDDPLEDFKTWVSTKLAKTAYKALKDKISALQGKLSKDSEYYKVEKDDLVKTTMLEDEDIEGIMTSVDMKLIANYGFNMMEVRTKVLQDIIITQVNTNRSDKLVNETDGGDFNYDWIPLSIMTPYATGDAVVTLRCAQWLKKFMLHDEDDPEHKILKLWLETYPNIVMGLVLIQHYGISIDHKYMNFLKDKYAEQYDTLIEELGNTRAGQATSAFKQKELEKGLKEFKKPKYRIAFKDDGTPKLKKTASLSEEEQDELRALDKIYTSWNPKSDTFPQELKDKGYRDEVVVKLRNKYKDNVDFSSKPSDIGYALFEVMKSKVPFEEDYFSDASWKRLDVPAQVKWEDYSLSAKTTIAYISDNGTDEQKEFADRLIELAKVKTLKSDFTDKLEKHLSNKDGRSHGSFSETGTETSRLSASNPNLQQLPHATTDVTRFDYKYPVKREFISQFDDGVLYNIDYSNLEMRVAGLISGDKGMYKTFITGGDIHKATAAEAMGIPEEEVTKEQRQQAKSLNFGIIYGRGSASIAKQTGQTKEEAEAFEDSYMEAKPAMKKFIEESHEFVQDHGYVQTLPGFRRWLRSAWSTNKGQATKALRQSVNTIVQGTGAFLTNNAVYYVNKFYLQHNMRSRAVITVHDSIVVDTPQDEALVAGEQAKYIMENLPFDWLFVDVDGVRTRYPIAAENAIGLNYNDMVDFDREEFVTFKSAQGYCKYFYKLETLSHQYESGAFSEDDEENEKLYNQAVADMEATKTEYQEM